jgi:hypothetical protein
MSKVHISTKRAYGQDTQEELAKWMDAWMQVA